MNSEEALRLEEEERKLEYQEQHRLNQMWQDSPEFSKARGDWLSGPNCSGPFENSREFTNGRYLFRKRINAGGDGNEG